MHSCELSVTDPLDADGNPFPEEPGVWWEDQGQGTDFEQSALLCMFPMRFACRLHRKWRG